MLEEWVVGDEMAEHERTAVYQEEAEEENESWGNEGKERVSCIHMATGPCKLYMD